MPKLSLLELERCFQAARTLTDLNAALREYLADLGITTFAFTYYSYYPNSLNKLKYDMASENFSLWHKHYIDENYEKVDTTLNDVYQMSLPKFWDLHAQVKAATSTREKQMRLDSIAFGSEKGISIPIHGPQEDFAILLIVQRKGQTCLNHWQELQYELFCVGYYYYSYLQPLLLKDQEPVHKFDLSKREIQCLFLIAKQTAVPDMAKKLNISERTVNYHIQRINKKFGTKNKYQSVAKAIKEGIIKL